jgi:hypothetical protein
MNIKKKTYVYFFPDLTLLVPACKAANDWLYIGQCEGSVVIEPSPKPQILAAHLWQVYQTSGTDCERHIESYKDLDESWMKVSGRKTKRSFVEDSILISVSNSGCPGEISITLGLPVLGRPIQHFSQQGVPEELVPDTTEPLRLAELTIELRDEGYRFLREGLWDTQKGELRKKPKR